MVRKALGMDHILESILCRLGDLEAAALIDDYAEGKDTGIIDLALLGDIDHANLRDLVTKAERYLDRKIRMVLFEPGEQEKYNKLLDQRVNLKLWNGS